MASKNKKIISKSKKNNSTKLSTKHTRLIALIVIIISLGVLFSTVGYTLYKYNQSKDIIKYLEVTTSAEVAGNPGLNADKDGLKYGKVPPGASGIRYLDINASEDAIVNLYISGDLAEYMTVDENHFDMKSGESKRVPFYLQIPDDKPFGFYDGKVTVIITRPKD